MMICDVLLTFFRGNTKRQEFLYTPSFDQLAEL